MQILDGRKHFVQWDKDLKLISEDLSVGDQVHFDNGTTPNALIVIAKEYEGKVAVDVPNILLTNPFQIKVYRYVETEEGSYTKKTTLFDVESRKKPDDYVYTQTEVITIEDAVNAAIESLDLTYVRPLTYMDETDGNLALEDYKNGKTFPDTYNRVYVELSEGRGVYGRYCLTAVDAPKDPDPEDYAKGKTLDSIPMRMSNGYIMAPIIRADDVEALAKLAELGYSTDYYLMPKSYIDSYVDRLFKLGENGGLIHGSGSENTGKCNISVGVNTKATAAQASAFGDATEATAWTAFAINRNNKAKNAHSFVGGIGNESSRDGQTVLGRYAKPDANYNLLIGVGDSETSRVNGFGVMWDGRVLIGKDPTAPMHAVPLHLLEEKLADIVGSAPETLNALNELATALGNDPNFATTVANQIGAKASKKELQETESAILEGLNAILAAQEEILGGEK